ncbi:MAG: hypothetical protein ACOCVY_03390, partial [Patescibacteria group bacterium]
MANNTINPDKFESGSAQTLININVDTWLLSALGIIIFLFFLLVLKKIIKDQIEKKKYLEHKVFLIRIPKEDKDNGEERTTQQLREEIAKAETVFASIGGLKAQKGFSARLFGRDDQFSFEIVANKGKISFYVVAPKKMGRYIEQQIHAHYPEAAIEETDDYNIFHPNGASLAGYVKTARSFVFPLKTYNKMEADPMNSLVNVMSKLEKEEGMTIQILVRSALGSWHKRSAQVAREITSGKSPAEALRANKMNKVMFFLGEVVNAAKPTSDQKNQSDETPKKLSSMEEEMVKGIEEKNYKAGLDVNIRVVVGAKDKGKAGVYLNNIDNAFGQYNYYEYGNSVKSKIPSRYKQKRLINDFIYRRFSDKIGFLLNTEELAGIYHFPIRGTDIPNILWLTAKHAPAPADLPDEGLLLGYNHYRGIKKEVKIKKEDRRRHSYIIGKSGTGKSKFIAGQAIQDIINGEGVCLLDPHGDLVEDVLNRIPPERAEDVIHFAPADTERPLGINLLEYDSRYPEQKTFVVNEMIKIFDKLYDLSSTGGPMFEQYMRNAMLLVMGDPASGSTLMEIPKVLSDADFRKYKMEKCGDPTVVDFWKKEAEKAG